MEKLKQRSLLQFDNWASFYDSTFLAGYFTKYYEKVEAYLGDLSDKTLLSVGCGTGTLEISLAQKYPQSKITGLDISQKMVKRAKSKSVEMPNVEFFEGDSENLQFGNESFDYVLCIHSFHHYPDQLNALTGFKGVLKKGGELVMIDAVKDSIIGRLWIFFNKTFVEPGVIHYSFDQLKKILQDAGFARVEVKRLTAVNGLIIGS